MQTFNHLNYLQFTVSRYAGGKAVEKERGKENMCLRDRSARAGAVIHKLKLCFLGLFINCLFSSSLSSDDAVLSDGGSQLTSASRMLAESRVSDFIDLTFWKRWGRSHSFNTDLVNHLTHGVVLF